MSSSSAPPSDTDRSSSKKQRAPAPPPSDSETDPGYRSRSQSRRARRRKAQTSTSQNQKPRPPPIAEEPPTQTPNGPESHSKSAMQPFERIGPDSTSMDGPVTYARAERGEIPPRDGNPNQALQTAGKKQGESSKMMDQDGLKLRLELNLDIEIELKASIHGDITLALLA